MSITILFIAGLLLMVLTGYLIEEHDYTTGISDTYSPKPFTWRDALLIVGLTMMMLSSITVLLTR